jgi:hypothetical protein
MSSLRIVAVFLATAGIACVLAAQEPPQPTDEHKVLAQDVGKWKTEMEMLVPGQDPLKSEGSEVGEAVCNGLFVQSVYTGEIMGMPFEGRSVMGYDTFKNKYTGTWVDNFGTSQYPMEGSYDADKKTMTVIMTGPNPMTGEEMKMKTVTTYLDENTKTFEMYGPDPTGQSDEMVKMMTMRSVRQK